MYEDAEDLCLYMPIRNEVDLEILREAAWRDGKRVWLPKVFGERMEFHFFGPESSLEEGAYGILEPEAGEVLEPGEATLVVMPGAVFSKSHDRIGYGGGYYDRYLVHVPYEKRIASRPADRRGASGGGARYQTRRHRQRRTDFIIGEERI